LKKFNFFLQSDNLVNLLGCHVKGFNYNFRSTKCVGICQWGTVAYNA